jgi:hypothetical protein
VLEALLRLAVAGDRLEADRLVVEPALGELVHAVALVQAALEREGDQHGVVDRRHLDAVAGEDGHVVLGVLRHLEHRRVLQQRLQLGQRHVDRHLGEVGGGVQLQAAVGLVADRDVAGLAGTDRQADPAEVRVKGASASVSVSKATTPLV